MKTIPFPHSYDTEGRCVYCDRRPLARTTAPNCDARQELAAKDSPVTEVPQDDPI